MKKFIGYIIGLGIAFGLCFLLSKYSVMRVIECEVCRNNWSFGVAGFETLMLLLSLKYVDYKKGALASFILINLVNVQLFFLGACIAENIFGSSDEFVIAFIFGILLHLSIFFGSIEDFSIIVKYAKK